MRLLPFPPCDSGVACDMASVARQEFCHWNFRESALYIKLQSFKRQVTNASKVCKNHS